MNGESPKADILRRTMCRLTRTPGDSSRFARDFGRSDHPHLGSGSMARDHVQLAIALAVGLGLCRTCSECYCV